MGFCCQSNMVSSSSISLSLSAYLKNHGLKSFLVCSRFAQESIWEMEERFNGKSLSCSRCRWLEELRQTGMRQRSQPECSAKRGTEQLIENLSASAQPKSSGQAALPSKVCSALCWFWLGQLQKMKPCFPGDG